jgi:hypothetical protein
MRQRHTRSWIAVGSLFLLLALLSAVAFLSQRLVPGLALDGDSLARRCR